MILVIPVILLFEFFGEKSFEEMEKANEVYYDKMLDSYISLYDEIVITDNVIYLREWLKKESIDTSCMYVGEVVDKLDDIQKSLRSCFEQAKKKAIAEKLQMAKDEESNSREEIQKQLKEQILAYLEVNFRDANLSQMQVADVFRISNYTLSRLFKNQVGVGFTEYLLSKRMEYAKELLLTTSHSISEVSCMAGFSGIDHFSKKFKSYAGVSPTAFRDGD